MAKLEVPEQTSKSIGETPAAVQIRVLRAKLDAMEDDDPKLKEVATKLYELEKKREKKRLEKRLRELDEDDDMEIFF